ncbi:hypothetical protein MC7420_1319 [Coleofasciculus chthonoplastes PCC 7420]|uniref:Uncharacterized protein n=1 Tax=Coleofasciculus chthonoplastes PCC 7420 TaxID=118168 RepID=B4VR39_9CYAN|nr:hypothetical protein MC7420_1319 [Coleofasciculus chthonoplastes PCC 7420]
MGELSVISEQLSVSSYQLSGTGEDGEDRGVLISSVSEPLLLPPAF